MKPTVLVFSVFFLVSKSLSNQNVPIIIQAESGTLGSDFDALNRGDATYITPHTNLINGTNTGNADKVASYTVNFTDSGIYKLFARVRVGSDGADNDSFFHGNGFGTKDPSTDTDWTICNNLSRAGFTIPNDVVRWQGDAASGVWKWICLSDHTGYKTPITFRVELGDLTQTFEIGSPEDGFNIDKLYPNPFIDGHFTIHGIQHITTLEVLDINGRQISTYDVTDKSSIEISMDVPAEVYFVRLSDRIRFYHVNLSVN
jgi:endo-1,4-beta-xylanase